MSFFGILRYPFDLIFSMLGEKIRQYSIFLSSWLLVAVGTTSALGFTEDLLKVPYIGFLFINTKITFAILIIFIVLVARGNPFNRFFQSITKKP